MNAQHATVPARSGLTSQASLDPWLRMRLAPTPSVRRPGFSSTKVRDALRAIAAVRPDPATLAIELRRVRALLDRERGEIRHRLAEGAAIAEVARAATGLLDGMVAGLCHLGHLLEPSSCNVPCLAVIARGAYGRRELALGARADLLFLVAGHPVRLEHGLAVARFVARELAGLEWQTSDVRRTVRGCLAETHLDPATASELRAGRLVWGCRDLFADLMEALPRGCARAFSGMPQRSARAVLAA